MAFDYPVTVRFQHCDPAGIVFYPRYMEMVNTCVETWFEQQLGFSYANLHLHRQLGTPTVHLESNFMRPSRLEDRLNLRLSIIDLGDKSVKLSIHIVGNEEVRATVDVTLVLVDLKAMQSMPWSHLPELHQALNNELDKRQD